MILTLKQAQIKASAFLQNKKSRKPGFYMYKIESKQDAKKAICG